MTDFGDTLLQLRKPVSKDRLLLAPHPGSENSLALYYSGVEFSLFFIIVVLNKVLLACSTCQCN